MAKKGAFQKKNIPKLLSNCKEMIFIDVTTLDTQLLFLHFLPSHSYMYI